MAVLPDDYPEQIMTVLREALRPEVAISRPTPKTMALTAYRNGGGAGIAYLFSFPGSPLIGFLDGLVGRSAKEAIRTAVVDTLRTAIQFCNAGDGHWRTPLEGDVGIDIQESEDAVVAQIRGSVSGVITLSPVYLRPA